MSSFLLCFWKTIPLDIELLTVFFFQDSEYIIPLTSRLHHFLMKCQLLTLLKIPCTRWVTFLCCFKIFSVSFINLPIMSLVWLSLIFILRGVRWASQMCRLMFFVKSGGVSNHFFFKYSFCSFFSLLAFWDSYHVYVGSTSFWGSVQFSLFFFSFYTSEWMANWSIVKSLFFSLASWNLLFNPEFFVSVIILFNSRISVYHFYPFDIICWLRHFSHIFLSTL